MKDAKEKQKKQNRRVTAFALVMGVAVVAVILALLLPQVIAADRTAVVIDGKKYGLCEYNYYYQTYYDTYCSENEQYLPYMFDTSKSLKTQAYDENQSWFDYFTDQAVESMTGVIAVADAARGAGFALPAADQAEIDTALSNVASSALNRNMTSDAYLSGIYGKGMTAELFREHLTNVKLAKAYGESVKKNFAFTDAELQKQYEQNPGKYALVDYERFYVKAAEPGKKPAAAEEAAAKATADEILSRVQAGESLKDVSADYADKGTYASFGAAYYDKSFSYGAWLFSPDRKTGDSAEIDDGSGWYVMVFHEADRGQYSAACGVDAAFAADGSAEDAKQQYEDACEKAETLRSAWLAGDGTAESAAKAAEQAGAETQSFTDLTKNTLDGNIESWLFDPARKPGESAVLYTETGFHAVLYTGPGRAAWRVLAEKDLREAKYGAWYDALLKGTKAERREAVLKTA